MLCPIVAFTFISLAILHSPWFTWTENYLSDLGAQGTYSILFNAGLIIAGILVIMFAIGLRDSSMLRKPWGGLGTLTLILGACALCAIGIFPKTTGAPHIYAAATMFVLIPLSMLLIGTTIVSSSNKTLGWFTIILGVVALGVSLIPWPWEGGAIPQMLSALPISAWAIIFGIILFKRAPQLNQEHIPQSNER